ncbi:hypothetical protein U1Q18_052130 [Sarracenia purpurea var. burkii]
MSRPVTVSVFDFAPRKPPRIPPETRWVSDYESKRILRGRVITENCSYERLLICYLAPEGAAFSHAVQPHKKEEGRLVKLRGPKHRGAHYFWVRKAPHRGGLARRVIGVFGAPIGLGALRSPLLKSRGGNLVCLFLRHVTAIFYINSATYQIVKAQKGGLGVRITYTTRQGSWRRPSAAPFLSTR